MRRLTAAALILASLCTGPLLAERLDWSSGASIERTVERCTPPYRLGNPHAAYNVAWDGGPFPPHYAPTYRAPWEFDMPVAVQTSDKQHQTQRVNNFHEREDARNQGIYLLSAQPQVPSGVLNTLRDVNPAAVASLPQQPFGERDAKALVQLGALAQWGHFCMINSDQPLLREQAYNVCRQLGSSLKDAGLADRFQQLAAGKLPPGATSQSASYDQGMHDIVHYVYNTYDNNGIWYYGLGTVASGMYVLYSGGDEFHTPLYRDLARELVTFQPWHKPSRQTVEALQELSQPPQGDPEDAPALCQQVLHQYWPLAK
ncbi:MAG: hypothetical protein ACYCW6_19925 [Candidatus Xenobia bacterium]